MHNNTPNHLQPAINCHSRPISYDRFQGMFSSLYTSKPAQFKQERWHVLGMDDESLYSIVIYYCQFDQIIVYHAMRLK